MITEAKYQDFIISTPRCGTCDAYKLGLIKSYEFGGLESAQKFINNYNGFICKGIGDFLNYPYDVIGKYFWEMV